MTQTVARPAEATSPAEVKAPAGRTWWRTVALTAGAIVFLFPFYYMIVGSLQQRSDSSLIGALPMPGNLGLNNYGEINAAINLGRSLLNSVIFTAGVVVGTLLFGVLAGYAMARLRYRGRGTLFASMLLLQVIPFQLLVIPLYVQIVRSYGLADSYLGMILPFAIN